MEYGRMKGRRREKGKKEEKKRRGRVGNEENGEL